MELKRLTVGDIMLFNNIIYKLNEQQIKYPINIAYKIVKLKQQFDEIETMMVSRWSVLMGEDFDLNNLTEEQKLIYTSTLSAEVEINTHGLTVDNITDNNKVELTLSETERLIRFLG